MRDFDDKVAVVTGASSGIGRATALQLASRGCRLALVDIDADGLADVESAVRALGREASTHRVDVSDRSAMERLPEEVLARHGAVHVVVNNAGYGVIKTLQEHSLDEYEGVVGVNFWGVLYGCKLFLPHLLSQPSAHIVNVSSAASFSSLARMSSYCATKSAVQALSESLAQELHATSVGVTSIHPGGVRTNIVKSSKLSDSLSREELQQTFDKAARVTPEQVARKIVRAIERDTLQVKIAPEAYLLAWFRRLMPTTVVRLLGWAFAREEASRRG